MWSPNRERQREKRRPSEVTIIIYLQKGHLKMNSSPFLFHSSILPPSSPVSNWLFLPCVRCISTCKAWRLGLCNSLPSSNHLVSNCLLHHLFLVPPSYSLTASFISLHPRLLTTPHPRTLPSSKQTQLLLSHSFLRSLHPSCFNPSQPPPLSPYRDSLPPSPLYLRTEILFLLQ